MASTDSAAQQLPLFNRRGNQVLVLLSAIALAAMALMITWDVIVRYLFNAPLPASVEISEILEPYVIFLPFAYTLAAGRHVRVTIITMRLKGRLGLCAEAFTYLVDLLLFSLFAYYACAEFCHSFAIGEIMMAAIRLPWWLGKLAMPVGMFFICLQCVINLVLLFTSLRKGS
ncbi:MAG: TRAP transporter small permease [Pseudomonadota bacterium]